MNSVPFPVLYGLAGILAGRLLRAVIPLFCPDAAALRIPPEPLACLLFFLCCGVYGPGYYSLLSCAVCSLLLEAALVDSACFLIFCSALLMDSAFSSDKFTLGRNRNP